MSQFDQLLDFGEPVTPETNGTSPKTGAEDDFDPFGPSPTIEGKGTTDSNLLVDFSIDSEVSNGKPQNGTADPFDMNFEVTTTESSNPLYEMSSETPGKTVFIEDGDTTNPLYEFTTKTEISSTQDSTFEELHPQGNTSNEYTFMDTSNPLYELSNNADIHEDTVIMTTTTTSESANPLYDLMGNGDEHDIDDENTVVTTTEKVTQDEDLIVTETSTTVESTMKTSMEMKQENEQELTPNSEEDFVHIEYNETKTEEPLNDEVDGGPSNVDVGPGEVDGGLPEVDDGLGEVDATQGKEVDDEPCQIYISQVEEEDGGSSVDIRAENEQIPIMFTEEDTVEATNEDTVEATNEVTVEVTNEDTVEVTNEVTDDVIDEVTDEVAREPERFERSRSPSRSLDNSRGASVSDHEEEKHNEVTYKSSTFISLSPSTPTGPSSHGVFSTVQSKPEEEVLKDGQTVYKSKEEKRYSDSYSHPSDLEVKQDFSTPHYLANEQAQQNGVMQTSPNVTKETVEKEEFHFSEMSSVKNTFESGKDTSDYKPSPNQDITWDEQEEGVYENEPMKRSDVFRESDRNIAEGLPEVGMAKNLLNKFAHIQDQPAEPKRKEMTPPDSVHGRVEYVSEPRAMVETYQGRADAGVFENQPDYNPDVVRSGGHQEDILPEQGMAKNVASKFKELEKSGGSVSHSTGKREITPDRDGGKVEFVSEPRGYVEKYEGRADSGVFENQPGNYQDVVKCGQEVQEELPERGYAKNIASKFKQMESGTVPSPGHSRKKEMTPDRSTKVEYVSEPRGYVETYEGKAEAGVFENQPRSQTTEIIKSDQAIEDEPLPEKGYAQNIAAKFREMESSAKSPPPTPTRIKEITPPRDDANITQNSGIFESQPQVLPDVVRADDSPEDIVPETGSAKSLVSRFKQIQAESSKTVTSSRQKREMTPPKSESGVFENQPKEFVAEYNKQAESGISENVPEETAGVVKETDPPKYKEELPERGMAKNLVSRWKQMENQGAKQSPPSGLRTKEFTPPREEERVKAARSPRSPLSPSGGQNQSVQPEDLPGQYHQTNEPTVFESEPGVREDVYREADTDWMEGMPKSNTTQKLLAKFKHIQEEAKKEPTPVSKTEEQGDTSSESPSRIETKVCSRKSSSSNHQSVDHSEVPAVRSEKIVDAKKSGYFVAVQTEKCGVCGKSVYAMERLEMNKVVYHKTCFKCSQCKSTLTPKTFAVNNGTMYCTSHYKQLFARKGNYDEGFGREQHKKKWRSEPSLNDSEQEAT